MHFLLKTIDSQTQDAFYDVFEEEKTYLQASQYGAVREALGEKNIKKGVFLGDQLIGIAQFQKITARRGMYLPLPHGPLIEAKHLEPALSFFLEEYKKIGEEEGCDFVRISCLFDKTKKTVFQKLAYKNAPVHLVNPEKTWVLKLEASEDDLLAQMKKSTRYEVRRIEKMGLKVQQGNTSEDLDIFWNLHSETVRRQGFVPFPRSMTEKEIEIFGKDIQIFSTSIDHKFYSSSVIIFDKNAGYYHQGASTYSKLPVAHATIWAAINEAKKRGCKEFNFWGICDGQSTKHPWYGLSRFKRGFGGEERNYLHVQDFPLTKKYWLNWCLEKWRKWKKKL